MLAETLPGPTHLVLLLPEQRSLVAVMLLVLAQRLIDPNHLVLLLAAALLL